MFLREVTHRNVTAEHYLEGKKYMIWYHLAHKYDYKNTVGIVQVRGIKEPLSEEELKHHIDKLFERSRKEKNYG